MLDTTMQIYKPTIAYAEVFWDRQEVDAHLSSPIFRSPFHSVADTLWFLRCAGYKVIEFDTLERKLLAKTHIFIARTYVDPRVFSIQFPDGERKIILFWEVAN